jgi:response regulator RpfG family c-di-GMP phosphodiesterase
VYDAYNAIYLTCNVYLMNAPIARILIVDDDPIQLLYLSKTLSKLETAEIHTQASSERAISLCRQESWDLVIVDYHMPQLDGLGFVTQLRGLAQHRCTPVLMVTASSDPGVKHQVLACGTVDFLQKPVDSIELQARARNLLDLHAATQQLTQRNIRLQKNVAELIDELRLREFETLRVLARTAEFRDTDTGSHLTRMAEYSRLIAQQLELDDEMVQRIFLAAPMHDVGKIGIPDHILLKPSKLSPDEWAEMQRHAEYGYEILRHTNTPVLKLGAEIAWCHHESWDGTGYPRGLKAEQIPMSARIVAVADVFDALTTKRPYKSAWSLTDAIKELRQLSSQKLDPACVQALMACLDEVKIIMEKHQDVD